VAADSERSLAIFIDFENLALGFQGRRERFDITRVLERLVEKGKIVVKKAYADWSRFSHFTHLLHEAAIELIEIPKRAVSGKNSADIRLCVDAMDLAYSKEHINTFTILSGDSDFSPLVSKLKELGKHVIGLGMQESTSDLLRDNCDEFIYYEDLGQPPKLAPSIVSHLPDQKRKAFELLLESLAALRRENKEVLWSSMIKDTMKRKRPSFNETYHGYRTFSELLEDAKSEGILDLETDKRSRTYVVTRFGPEMHVPPQPTPSGEAPIAPPFPSAPYPVAGEIPPQGLPGRRKSRRRRRRGQGAGGNGNNGSVPTPGQPTPVANFQPVEIPAAGPIVGIEVVPSPSIPPEPAQPSPPRAPVATPEPVAPATETEAPETKPATKSRSRSTRTTKTSTTTRSRRTGTRGSKATKADESASSAESPSEKPSAEP
jgi:uncharacterized protein (TIGR00288 family)